MEEDAVAARKRQRQESRLRRKQLQSAKLAEEEAAAAAERRRQVADSEHAISDGKKRKNNAKPAAEVEGDEAPAEEKKRKKTKAKAASSSEEDDELEAAQAELDAAQAKMKLLRLKKERAAAKAAAKAAADDEDDDEPEEAVVKPVRLMTKAVVKGRVCRADAQAEAAEMESAPSVAEKAEEPSAAENTESGEGKSLTAFVGGLPSHVDESYINRDFGECGKITNVVLARWPEDGSSKGICFITFATESALNKCVEWNGQLYENKPLRIEKKEGKDRPKQKDRGLGGQRGVKPEGCLSVAVLDMSKNATEDDLMSFFGKCGTISSVKVLKHRQTLESRGIAFVAFEHTDATDEAVGLSGKSIPPIGGLPARIEYAAPKNDTDFVAKGKGKGKGGAQKKPEGCVAVVVRNLSLRTTEDELWDLFKGCPSASNISVLPGLAFVDFGDTNDTDVAVKVSGAELHGQAIVVTYKMPK